MINLVLNWKTSRCTTVDALNAAIKQLTVDKTELNNLAKTQIEDKSQYTEKSYNDYESVRSD